MRIGELAQRTGVSKDTIRFYEKIGLLEEYKQRGDNNYRHYDEEVVSRLLFIKQGKTLGLTLKEIKTAIEQWDILSDEEKILTLKEKIREMDEKIKQFQDYKYYLSAKLERLKTNKLL